MDQDNRNKQDQTDNRAGRADRLRRHGQRLVGSASGKAQSGYARASTYLMARPPMQRTLLLALWGGAALAALLLVYVVILIPLTPGTADLRQARAAKPTVLLSADGKELAKIEQGLQERVKLSQVSPHVLSALIATEDHRFYNHHGVDFTRLAGAMLATLKGDAQGGSTITQQLARNMFPEEIGRSRSVNRKLKELVTALKIENTYSKTEILEAYLNTVPFLYNAFGIEMAARTYFDKPAAKLDVLESATLIGMLKGTNYYNPVTNPERSLQRRNVVLGQMRKHGVFTEARYRALIKRPLRVHFSRQAERNSKDNHFAAYVRKWLLDWADENDYNLQLDGLVVHTTLDYGLQQAAVRAVEREGNALQAIADVEWADQSIRSSTSTGMYSDLRGSVTPFGYFWRSRGDLLNAFVRESGEYKQAVEGGEDAAAALKRFKADRAFISRLKSSKSRLEAGFVAMDPLSGEVKAWVGSRDFERDQYDHVVQATRQPGSTFKPIVYGAALEKGISPDHPYLDAVLSIKAGDGKVWRPTDMNGSSGRQMTLRDGLVYSKNTITAQVMQDVGLPDIVRLAKDLGIRESKLESVPSLALGTSPVTLLEMVNAYSSIAAQGEYRKPQFVKRITDRNGTVIADFGGDAPQRVMSAASSATLIDMMRGVINRGTGTGVRYRYGIQGDVAGKTGTTQKNADGWFIMMHPHLVAGAWIGFNDNRVTMRSNYWGQGGHNAILVVGNFFKSALDSGRIDKAAVFPGGRPAPPPRPPEEEDDQFQVIEEAPGDFVPEGGEIDDGIMLPPVQRRMDELLPAPAPSPEPEFEEPVEVDEPIVIEEPVEG